MAEPQCTCVLSGQSPQSHRRTGEVDEGRNKTIAFSANRIGTFVCQIINIVSVIIIIIFMLAVINITMTIKTEKLTFRELMRVEHATTQICSDEKI